MVLPADHSHSRYCLLMIFSPTPAIRETDPLVVAIVSVFLTLVVGVVTASLARKGEHAKWLREQRYEAYVAFMIDMSTVTSLLDTELSLANVTKVKSRADAYTEKASASFEAVSLLGPRKVNAAGQQWVWAANAYARTKTTRDQTALSKTRWRFLVVAGKVLNSNNVSTEAMTRPGAAPETGSTTT